jgi:hypothetical protein
MRTTYDASLRATVTVDDAQQIRTINHTDEYRETEHQTAREAATAYIRSIAERLRISPNELRGLDQRVSYVDPQPQDVEYRLSEEKLLFDTATYAFYQTFLNTPVWESGLTVTLKQSPPRVVAATNTSSRGINAEMPSAEAISRYRQLFAAGEKVDGRRRRAAIESEADFVDFGSSMLSEMVGPAIAMQSGDFDRQQTSPKLIRGRFFVYQYDSKNRAGGSTNDERNADDDQQPLCGTPPTLPLPPVPDSIEEGRWYVVSEIIFRMPYQGEQMNWRMLVELESDAILYLRALTSGITGNIFSYDPITSTGTATNTPDQSNTVLNPLRSNVVLPNLDAPVGGTQSLAGNFVALSEIELATVAPPTRPSGSNFDTYDVRTNEFAAVNAYYHTDRFFQLVASLGFPLATYFDGTTFPVEVDHRGKGTALNMGNTINAHCVGDADGIDHACFALADLGDTANPIGIATDWRVVLHELGGHGTLEDHVGSPNFGFAHSAGDSFAMILNDYVSEWHNGAAIDRFVLAPFVPAVGRRSDRTVAAGWGWGGVNDTGIQPPFNPGYESEQILSTTMFRAYRSIGGDSTALSRRTFAARYMAYLMLRAIGNLTSLNNPNSPAAFLATLLTADAGDWTTEGVFGGAYGKVLTWSFERQNLNGGVPPAVDVYIDDGRAGEYDYQPVHWQTTAIWNRRNPDGGLGHDEPALGVPNYAYVKIKNRGTSVANNVIVKGYHSKPSAGVFWPNDLQPFTTAQLPAGTLQPNNTEEKIVGPFEWTPIINAWGHDCMFMIVSADGDPSNVDNLTAGGYYEDWRLVPNDNNVGQRNVTLAPGGGGSEGLVAGLEGKGFWIGNPSRATASVVVSIALPQLLTSRGWRISLHEVPADGVRLKPREQMLVTFKVERGKSFTKAEAEAATDRNIVVTATADGAIVGGMVYHVDPEIELPYNDRNLGKAKPGCLGILKQLWKKSK